MERAGYAVLRAYSGTEALLLLKDSRPDLVLLDLMLPGLSGEEVLPKLRGIPVIVMSAKASVDSKVELLLGGAADYVTKPFDIPELISRINAVLRRSAKKTTAGVLKLGNITVDSNSRRVTVGENEVTLTYKEFELLSQLIRNKGLVMTRDKLMVSVWGTDFKGESRTVDVHIRTLRQKLGAAGSCIETVRNVGYKVD